MATGRLLLFDQRRVVGQLLQPLGKRYARTRRKFSPPSGKSVTDRFAKRLGGVPLPKKMAGPEMFNLDVPASTLANESQEYAEHPVVKYLLDRIVSIDLDKVFAPRRINYKSPRYQLATDTHLKKLEDAVTDRAVQLLTRPPIMKMRKPIENRLIEESETLTHFDESKFVFTDVEYGLERKDRRIVIRHPDGRLEHADWDVRDRMMRTYFLREGQERIVPPLFEPENMKIVLSQGRHEELLNRTVMQFDADSPDYICITETVYEDVNSRKCFDVLDSTCHFGGFVFYLAQENKIQGLLEYLLTLDRKSQAVDLIHLNKILTHAYTPKHVEYLAILMECSWDERERLDEDFLAQTLLTYLPDRRY